MRHCPRSVTFFTSPFTETKITTVLWWKNCFSSQGWCKSPTINTDSTTSAYCERRCYMEGNHQPPDYRNWKQRLRSMDTPTIVIHEFAYENNLRGYKPQNRTKQNLTTKFLKVLWHLKINILIRFLWKNNSTRNKQGCKTENLLLEDGYVRPQCSGIKKPLKFVSNI